MINRKFIVTTVLSVLLIGANVVFADSSNDLLRMDVKRSSAQDAVDVTFYTTGGATNSVVTRKSGNSYVVLLPNVSGSQSVVPSLGGVKDLVSDVTVKKVDDGIGGYTKITFNTVKPVKIQTYTKKTAPLTQAQQDYKAFIAQNSNFDLDKRLENFKNAKSATQAQTQTKPAVSATSGNKTAQPQPKPAVQKQTTKAATTSTTAHTPVLSNVIKQANAAVSNTKNTVNNTVKNVKNDKIASNTEKQQTNAKKTVVPVVKPEVKPQTTQPKAQAQKVQKPAVQTSKVENKPKAEVKADKVVDKKVVKNNDKVKVAKVKTHKESSTLPIIPIAGALSVIGISLLAGLINMIARAVGGNSNKLREYLENYNSSSPANKAEDYQAILDNDKLSWQEKYKLFSAKQSDKVSADISYVKDLSSEGGYVITDEMGDKIKANLAKMEHAYATAPSDLHPDIKLNTVQSEDDAIASAMSGIKLKSFAKNINLKETSRNVSLKNRNTNSLQEGPHVALSNSALSMSRRKSASSKFNIADLVRSGSKFLKKDKREIKIAPQEEQYIVSSLNEYLNMIDEDNYTTAINEQISNMVPSRSRSDMMNVTNPMEKVLPFKNRPETSTVNGLTVKSRYDIDSERSFYMVDLDGISALVGKIGEEIFILKKFDKVINKPLQVRQDYGNVYIVRVGSFKCLVDVAEDKMGTLLEI